MKLHSEDTEKLHKDLLEDYKTRLEELESFTEEDTEQEEPFERSFLHNAIYLHNLWLEQLESSAEDTKSPLLEEILEQRESDMSTFQGWISDFAHAAYPNGWAVWGWSYSLKTFVGFPMRSHYDAVPLGVLPILIIDCWEHSYLGDFGLDFEAYLEQFWKDLDWSVIEARHQELASLLGFGIK